MSPPGKAGEGSVSRLATGGMIDRARPVSFRFDGKSFNGFAGDTLASALIANGVKLVGRSFKYHRPRGILTAGSEEPNALVELRSGARREPNTRATTIELFDGLDATSQNRWPSLAFDVLSVNGVAGPLIGAGFYYKTFMWPPAFWEKLYEPIIRRAAGLGRAASAEDPDHYEKAFAHCDVLVIGAGPAGLAAALAAGRAGVRVILCDEDFTLGGRLISERMEVDGMPSAAWAADVEAELASMDNVRIFKRTTVYGIYDGGTYGAVERVNDHLTVPILFQPRQRLWRIVAKQAILAAGALERPLVFGDNDRPGIMLASAARSYVNRFAAAPGNRVAIFTSSDDGWRTAKHCADAGIAVEAVIDSRSDPSRDLATSLVGTGARTFFGARVVATSGMRALRQIMVADATGRETKIQCDALFVSGGWSPTLNLTCHLGGKPQWSEAQSAFLPGVSPPGITIAGAAGGAMSLAACLEAGVHAGHAASAGIAGRSTREMLVPRADDEPTKVSPMWYVRDSRGKAFVDFQNDVTTKDIGLAAREGYRSVELLKRYPTLGMATDQGKTANVNGLAILAEERRQSIETVGTTVYRPPYTPVAIGALGGHHRGKDFRPTRLTPGHAWALEQNAIMRSAGAWERAGWFLRPGEKDWLEATIREVKATRASVGVCDVSTLGKIDVQGPDAARFLDRVYTNTFSTLPIGKARYGLMLRDDGFVFDDGTTSRLGAEHFLMTTTTANAVGVMQHLEFYLQVIWPDLDVQIASVSEQWAQFSIAGPQSRRVLEKVVDRQHDISNAAFPYMTARDVTAMGGTQARLFRISFSGELAYELAVPARDGDKAIRALMAAGAEFGITPYGLEALSVMRIEKGHVAGSELTGQATARDLGLGKMMSNKKDYIGRTMANRPALIAPGRLDFIGVKAVDPKTRLRSGAHFIPLGAPANIDNDHGFVTSTAFSPMFDRWLGLGMLGRGRARIGERLRTVDPLRGEDIEIVVCDPIFLDPEGERLHG